MTELLDRWRKIPVAVTVDLHDSIRQINPRIRPLNPLGDQQALFGNAVTALCEPPDFGAVLHAVDAVQRGEVLVIAAGGHSGNAMIGEVLGGHLRNKGVAGVVCDGAIRDAEMLAGWPELPIYYRSINPRGPVGAGRGAANQPVVIDDTVVNSGDLIIGDADGLVVLSPDELERWIDAAEARLETEAEWVAKLADGMTMAELFELER